ncbi:MAG: putative transrane protein [Acidobacteria bacterium]|nr:putative transrane protein [Acidobacteriota bacterium]
MGTLASLLTSAGLGAGAGINSYATLLVLGIFARMQPGWFTDDVAHFFASTPVLIVVGVLYLIEFVADKIPAVDHVWDVIHTFIRPLAGAAAAWGAAAPGIPKGALVLAAVLGGATALSTHAVKASVRVASTATTAGCGNPVLSIVEDIFAFVNAILAILLPGVVVVILLLGTLLFLRLRRRQINDVGTPT